jgi:hypothetical protein
VIDGGATGTSHGAVLAGTNLGDALSTNAKIIDPRTATQLTTTGAYIHGFGRDDLIYGTSQPDRPFGGAGSPSLCTSTDFSRSGEDSDKIDLSSLGTRRCPTSTSLDSRTSSRSATRREARCSWRSGWRIFPARSPHPTSSSRTPRVPTGGLRLRRLTGRPGTGASFGARSRISRARCDGRPAVLGPTSVVQALDRVGAARARRRNALGTVSRLFQERPGRCSDDAAG